MAQLETVRIVDESKPAGYRIVNRTEYDRNRKKWKLWKPPEPEPEPEPEPPKPAPPPPSPSISTSTADKEAGGGSNSKRGGSKGPDRK